MLPPMLGKSIPRRSLQPCTDLRKQVYLLVAVGWWLRQQHLG
jgi:hypothetical protein